MEQHWRIWISVGYGAVEYVGEAIGDTFAEACRHRAESDPGFAREFNPRSLSLRGCPLVPLDRRIDGPSIRLGDARDAVAGESGPW